MHRQGHFSPFAGALLAYVVTPIAAVLIYAFDALMRITDVRWALDRIAAAFTLAPTRFAYAGPDAPASLRHEAGMHRRSAARNV